MKYGKKAVDEICKFIESMGTRNGAAGYVGISERTFYRWLDAHPVFRQKVELSEQKRLARAENKMQLILNDPEHRLYGTMLIFFLKTQCGYSEKHTIKGELEVAGTMKVSPESEAEFDRLWDSLDSETQDKIKKAMLESRKEKTG